jgi:hypothetical protein
MAQQANQRDYSLSLSPLRAQAFTHIARDVMVRLQQEQADQQAASALSPITLTPQLDRAKQQQRRRTACCDY